MKGIEGFTGKVIEGEWLEALSQIPDSCVDFIFTDVPYGSKEGIWDIAVDLGDMWNVYDRIGKPSSVIALSCHGAFTGRLRSSNEAIFSNRILWGCAGWRWVGGLKVAAIRWENVLIFQKPTNDRWQSATSGEDARRGEESNRDSSREARSPLTYRSDVHFFEFDETFGENQPGPGAVAVDQICRPKEKSEAFARYLIRTYTEAGGLVLEAGRGYGFFLTGAKKEQRRFVGIAIRGWPEVVRFETGILA
jgi:site-specific DNA-methyltransferase (adenine-specific)